MMQTYAVVVSRGERYWIVDVPQVERATQAKRLRDVEAMARDLISLMTNQPEDSFQLSIETRLPSDVSEHLRSAEHLRGVAADAQKRAADEARAAARALGEAGLTVRDIGDALGISHQRAHQLVHA